MQIIAYFPEERKEDFIMARINWKEEFDKADAECITLYHEQQKEILRKIIIGLALEMNTEKGLKDIATFMAAYHDKVIAYTSDGYKLENKQKGGVA